MTGVFVEPFAWLHTACREKLRLAMEEVFRLLIWYRRVRSSCLKAQSQTSPHAEPKYHVRSLDIDKCRSSL